MNKGRLTQDEVDSAREIERLVAAGIAANKLPPR
jgi:hypothetical protein